MRLEKRKKQEDYRETMEMIRQIEDGKMIQAPVHMKEEILKRAERPDYRLAAETKKLSRNAELLLYSMKVSMAVAAALLMLFVMPADVPAARQLPPQEKEQSLGERMDEGIKEINQKFHRMMWDRKGR